MEIKKREVLFSAIIILIMLAVGFWISGCISDNIDLKLEAYTTAVRIEDETQFDYGMRTNFGNALVYGAFTANEPVTFSELNGSFLEVTKTKERYTMHTRTVTTTVNGKTQTRTETYWTWDYAGSETKTSGTISFLDHDFNTSQFRFNNVEAAYLPDGSRYNYTSGSVRYYYNAIPASFDGTIHANLVDQNIGEQVDVFHGQRPDNVVSNELDHKNVPIIVFWVVWLLAPGGAACGFLYLENRWLD